MTDDVFFAALRELIQKDVGNRGLSALFEARPNDLENACRSLAAAPTPRAVVVTGFFIPSAGKPETDGPFGACLLAYALRGHCTLAAEDWLAPAFLADDQGIRVKSLHPSVASSPPESRRLPPTHLIAIERPGPTWSDGRLRTMRAADITDRHADVHHWFEAADRGYVTIAIGDGGNEIGTGSLPRRLIEENIPGGSSIACRTPADHLIVAGLSNWGAYALAAGYLRLRGGKLAEIVFDEERHRARCGRMVREAGLVDGITSEPTLTVDGQPWDTYIRVFRAIRELLVAG